MQATAGDDYQVLIVSIVCPIIAQFFAIQTVACRWQEKHRQRGEIICSNHLVLHQLQLPSLWGNTDEISILWWSHITLKPSTQAWSL